MSTNTTGLHLNDDQLVLAVVDLAELPPPLREHLSTCPHCQANQERIEQDLAQLGQMAEHFAPTPTKPVSLPAEESRSSVRWSWGWRTYVGAAIAATLALILVWRAPVLRTPSGGDGDMRAQEMQEAEQLMTEVASLVENALPPAYEDISAESSAGLDEEFMQFVVPSIEDEPVSYYSGKRGVLLC